MTTELAEVLLVGGMYDFCEVRANVDGVNALAVRSGNSLLLYVRSANGLWCYDRRHPDSIGEDYEIVDAPAVEVSRSFVASTSSSNMAGLAAELRSIGAVFDAELQATKDHLRRRTTWRVYAMTEWGASDSELQAEIDRLNLEIKLATRQSVRRRQLEMEAKRVEYAKPVPGLR